MKEKLTYIKVKEFLIHYWFWIWISIALISFVIGYIGFVKAFEKKGDKGHLDYLYYTIKLATFESLPELEEENSYLKISKLTAPLSLFMLSAGAVYFLLLNKILVLRLRRFKGHVVIFGLGHMGMIFLNQKRRERKKIVVVLREEEKTIADDLLELRIPVIYGSPSEDLVLQRARINYASEIYILYDDDILNAVVANKVLKLIKNSTNNSEVTCSVHINNYEFKRSIEKEEWIRKEEKNVNLLIFNIYEMTARYVLKEISLEPEGESVLTIEDPWVVIIGLDNMGYALLRQLIRMKVYPGDKRLRITIFDSNAQKHEEIFLSMYYDPNDRTRFIFRNVELYFVEKDLEKIHSIYELFDQTIERLPHVIYISADDDALTNIITYKIKLSLEKFYKEKPDANEIKIIAFFRNTFFGSCKEEDTECNIHNEKIKIYNINIIEKGCRSLIELSEIDTVARIIHSDFFISTFCGYIKDKLMSDKLMDKLKQIIDNQNLTIFEKELEIRRVFSSYVEKWIKEKPSRKEWQLLDEDFRNSNRHQADHLIDKLKVLNPKFTLHTDPKEVEDALNQGDKIEILAELEYKRYWAERYILQQKTAFSEYKDIPESEKEWNRDIARKIPRILSAYQERMTKGEKESFVVQKSDSPSEEFVLDPETLEKLAEAVHEVWMEGKLRDGWRLGDVIDKERKIHTCLVPYDQLSEQDKESDRDIARAIPKILEKAGYKIVKK